MIIHLATDLATRSFQPIDVVDVSPFHSAFPPGNPDAPKAVRWIPTTALAGLAAGAIRLANVATTVVAPDRWTHHDHTA